MYNTQFGTVIFVDFPVEVARGDGATRMLHGLGRALPFGSANDAGRLMSVRYYDEEAMFFNIGSARQQFKVHRY